MYIIVFAIILGIIFISFETIKNLIYTMHQNPNPLITDASVWFYGILFINLILFLFLQTYKYYVLNYTLVGDIGRKGERGSEGKCHIENIIECPINT